MAALLNWDVTEMNCIPAKNGNENIVINVHWRCFGQDGDYVSSVYGTCGLPENEENFIPYDQLTKEMVLSWVWSSGSVDKEAVENSVNQQIQDQISPPVINPALPW